MIMNAYSMPYQRIINIVLNAVLILLDIVLFVVLLISQLAWLGDPFRCHIGSSTLTISWGPRLLIALIIPIIARTLIRNRAAAAGLPATGLWKKIVFKRAILALLSISLFIGLLETTLAWIGFEANLPPIIFIGKNQDGKTVVNNSVNGIPDPILLWKLNPGTIFSNRRVNRLGFRDREVDPEKKSGTIRVICLGDSITAQGRPGYSQYLHERLTNNPPTAQPWEAFNMGVHGYTSMQGLKLFQTRGKLLKPDIVTIWFGWNDHWMSDKTDREKMAIETGAFTGPIMEAIHRKRLYMFMVWALKPVRHSLQTSERPFRVPPAEYQSTLELLVREVRKAGAIPVLITAPRRSLTEALVAKGFVNSPEEGQQIHDHYADMTRDTARKTHAFLLDLAALLTGKECDPHFAADGIHFDNYEAEPYLTDNLRPQPGLQRIAAELDTKIREIVHSQEWRDLH